MKFLLFDAVWNDDHNGADFVDISNLFSNQGNFIDESVFLDCLQFISVLFPTITVRRHLVDVWHS